MFKKLIIPALIAASISSVAVAQDRGQDRGRDDRNRGDSMQRDDHRGDDRRDDHRDNNRDHNRDNNRGNDYRGNDYRGDNRGNHGGPMAHYRGAGPRHDLQRGGRLPSQYRNRQYVVNDWRGHRLSAPPRGYQWVQTGSDYVLVAAATGLIAQILLNN
jgi:Ni/Co efflux regulator RcnB